MNFCEECFLPAFLNSVEHTAQLIIEIARPIRSPGKQTLLEHSVTGSLDWGILTTGALQWENHL